MSEIIIRPLSDPYFNSLRPQILQEIEDIFFESSVKKTFKTEKEKLDLKWKYLGFYLDRYPDYVWVAYSRKVLGYCLGMPKTQDDELYAAQPHLKVFEEKYKDFPAHLHINCHVSARGQGIGTRLIEELEREFKSQGIKGIHLMTSSDARNRSFYQRLGYDYECELPYLNTPILMMGKKL